MTEHDVILKAMLDNSATDFEQKGEEALAKLRAAEEEWKLRADVFFSLTVQARLK